MRRTGNTSVSPTIGIVVTGTAKIDFGPACASAEALCVAAPASASAPVASKVLRSTVVIGILLVAFFRFGCVSSRLRRARQGDGLRRGDNAKHSPKRERRRP